MNNLFYYILGFVVRSVLPVPVYWSNKRGGFYYIFIEDLEEGHYRVSIIGETVEAMLPSIRRFAFVDKKRVHECLLGTFLKWNGTRIERYVLWEDLTKDR